MMNPVISLFPCSTVLHTNLGRKQMGFLFSLHEAKSAVVICAHINKEFDLPSFIKKSFLPKFSVPSEPVVTHSFILPSPFCSLGVTLHTASEERKL